MWKNQKHFNVYLMSHKNIYLTLSTEDNFLISKMCKISQNGHSKVLGISSTREIRNLK